MVRSPCEKTFAFASKQHQLAPKDFEIHGKTFMVQGIIAKSAKVLSLEGFVLYSIYSNSCIDVC